MDQKEKEILNKLVKLAANQQKIINKLAQYQQPENSGVNIDYLKRAWQSAAANCGLSLSTPHVEYTEGSQEGKVQVGSTYTLWASDVPAKEDVKQKLLAAFKTQVKTQKPELDGKVGVIFSAKL